ncbi:43066_t:CDS:2 [Gigaspora margarita]|uniref:43066_t:CDS:1 n=1 Tax=Gigaspora margarita TaxID=4874 RepID=A0ABN7VEL9_GIGMA|nr:43066_t:CDS:2 [Gigaspora margarita]
MHKEKLNLFDLLALLHQILLSGCNYKIKSYSELESIITENGNIVQVRPNLYVNINIKNVPRDHVAYGHKVFAVSSQYDDTKKTVIKSPNNIWLTISQGISKHINCNSEKFHNRLVKHEGQKKLIIVVDGILGNWPEIVNRIVAEADNNTLEDWMKLQEKVAHLRKLNLELYFWLDRLEPIIWNLVATYRGEIDEYFQGRIVRIDRIFGSGGTYISGWLMNFFPYSGDHRVEIKDIPDGVVGIPFTLDGENLKFIAGFIGANQKILEVSNSESVVSSVIGWSIIEDVKNLYESSMQFISISREFNKFMISYW